MKPPSRKNAWLSAVKALSPAGGLCAKCFSSKAGSAASNTLGAMGSPDKVLDWEYDKRKLQTWLYSGKKQAFTFDSVAGSLVQKSDWNPPVAKK